MYSSLSLTRSCWGWGGVWGGGGVLESGSKVAQNYSSSPDELMTSKRFPRATCESALDAAMNTLIH